MAEISHESIFTNGVNLHVAMAGDKNGPLIILLHGFPEYWEAWKHQIPVLAKAGFRVWVPDQRGYNMSDKPEGIESYDLDLLVLDVIGLIEAAGVEKACIIGHDFGATVAWWLALLHPQRVERMAILNVPHPMSMELFLEQHLIQRLKSWYLVAFQIPWLPEWSFKYIGVWFLRRIGIAFKTADMRGYKEAFKQPGALKAMFHWYRAYVNYKGTSRMDDFMVDLPTLIIWGEKDIALDKRLAPLSLNYTSAGKLVSIPEASHFVQHDEADKVNDILLDWFEV